MPLSFNPMPIIGANQGLAQINYQQEMLRQQKEELRRQERARKRAENASFMSGLGGIAGGALGFIATGGNPVGFGAGSTLGSQFAGALSGGPAPDSSAVMGAAAAYGGYQQQQAEQQAQSALLRSIMPQPGGVGEGRGAFPIGIQPPAAYTQGAGPLAPQATGGLGGSNVPAIMQAARSTQNPLQSAAQAMQLQRAMQPAAPESYTLGEGETRFHGAEPIAVGQPKSDNKNVELKEIERDGQIYWQAYNKRSGEPVGIPHLKGDVNRNEAREAANVVFTQENTLRDDYRADSKIFDAVSSAIGKVRLAAAGERSPGKDVSLIFNYMKILDPASVVREGEQATAANAASVPDRVRDIYNLSLGGQRLTPEQRLDFLRSGEDVYKSEAAKHENVIGFYSNIADRRGLNRENVIVPFDVVSKADAVKNEKSFDSMTNTQLMEMDTGKLNDTELDALIQEMKRRGIQ